MYSTLVCTEVIRAGPKKTASAAVMPPRLHDNQRSHDITVCLQVHVCSVWDVRAGKSVRTLETGSVVTSIEVSDDGRHVTTADGSNVRIWDGNTLEGIKSLKVHRNRRVAVP